MFLVPQRRHSNSLINKGNLMKKYLYAGIIAACLSAPAFAGTNKFLAQSPEEPLHRRSVLLCIGVMLCLHALRHAPAMPQRRHQNTPSE